MRLIRLVLTAVIGASLLGAGARATARGAGSFTDTAGHPFAADIEWLRLSGITGGCAANRFCPDATVTREQMATFLSRALDLSAAGGDYFSDDHRSIHEADINRLAASRITGGCATNRFCPGGTVTREQMASFLVRGFGFPPPARTTSPTTSRRSTSRTSTGWQRPASPAGARPAGSAPAGP